ncbi:hypothetical protein [Massilia aerilata]|uniref:Ig-like domain-containing protein n=1 Tax=Massilia aerilata TaxID=453817 RepID=A0ABW0S004_9BURK
MMLALSACGGGGGGSTAAPPPVASVQAPVIATQPAPQSVAVGQAATFNVAATGDGLSYQWQRNGADIAGATGASYVLNNAQAADDGSRFTVVVRNAGGSTTSAAATLQVKVGQLSLLAGTLGGAGQMDGPVGRFNHPANVVSSPSGELWLNDYFLPNQSMELRKVSQAPGASPTVTTLPHKDPFVNVIGAVDAAGNRYENWYLAIHKTTPAGVRTLLAGNPRAPGSADGAGIDAGFGAISGMAVDAGGTLYVADRVNATIRKVSPAGVVTTLAGSAGLSGSQDGTGAAARFRKPGALVLDKAGNVYVLDDDTVLRKMTPAGVVVTVATVPRWISSSGYPDMAEPNSSAPVVGGLAVGDDGSVYVLSGNIRRVSPAGAVTNFAGDPFTWRAGATMSQDAAGNMYVVAPNQPVVFRVAPAGVISAFAGLPAAAEDTYGYNIAQRIRFGRAGLYADAQGNVTFVGGGKVRRTTAGGVVTTLAGPAFDDNAFPNAYSVSGLAYGRDLLAYSNGTLKSVDNFGNTTAILASVSNDGLRDGPRGVGSVYSPSNFLADSKGNIYFLDTVVGHVPTIVTQPAWTYVRRISPDGAITTLRDASQDAILHWLADKDGNILFGSADGVKRMTPDGAVSTLYARPADLAPLAFYGPMALDRSGNLYIASEGVLRKITPAGTVSIVAGTPGVLGVRLGALPGSLNEVSALTVGDDGALYLQSENAVLKLTQ